MNFSSSDWHLHYEQLHAPINTSALPRYGFDRSLRPKNNIWRWHEHSIEVQSKKQQGVGEEIRIKLTAVVSQPGAAAANYCRAVFYLFRSIPCIFTISSTKRRDNCYSAITALQQSSQLPPCQRLMGSRPSRFYFTVEGQPKVVKVYINGSSNNMLDYIYCRVFSFTFL